MPKEAWEEVKLTWNEGATAKLFRHKGEQPFELKEEVCIRAVMESYYKFMTTTLTAIQKSGAQPGGALAEKAEYYLETKDPKSLEMVASRIREIVGRSSKSLELKIHLFGEAYSMKYAGKNGTPPYGQTNRTLLNVPENRDAVVAYQSGLKTFLGLPKAMRDKTVATYRASADKPGALPRTIEDYKRFDRLAAELDAVEGRPDAKDAKARMLAGQLPDKAPDEKIFKDIDTGYIYKCGSIHLNRALLLESEECRRDLIVTLIHESSHRFAGLVDDFGFQIKPDGTFVTRPKPAQPPRNLRDADCFGWFVYSVGKAL